MERSVAVQGKMDVSTPTTWAFVPCSSWKVFHAHFHLSNQNHGGINSLSMCPFLNASLRRTPTTPKRSALSMLFRDSDKIDETHNRNLNQSSSSSSSSSPSSCPFHQLFPSTEKVSYAINPHTFQSDPEENLRGFIKTRGSLIPNEEFVFWWVGDIYAMIDDQPSKHLFAFEGYNIGRMKRVDGGWRMLTREVGLYKDPKTNEILTGTWVNPLTNKENDVVHVWNDPVNQQFLTSPNSPQAKVSFPLPTTTRDDDVYWNAEVFLNYPSPLPRKEFPDKSQSDMYQSAELFQFYTKIPDLMDPEKASATCQISWVRVGQWLPWMEMGDRQGKLVYHCRGKKLLRGFEDLSDQVKQYLVDADKTEFRTAPDDFSRPNETSWTYFKKLISQKGMPRADGTVARERDDDGQEHKAGASTKAHNAPSKNALPQKFTRAELSKYDGTDLSLPLLLGINGRVYDVTRGKKHYRKGESYNCMTGKDSTSAFVLGIYTQGGVIHAWGPEDVAKLSPEKKADLDYWVNFFDKEYDMVGELVDF
eukprot:CAMPEP_0184697378 /NCGR_PEP_ID=MMETSP0313-20130426/4351_1 /TAXON_ID=2792 /ORGANISM="Porphyridium aerugineum, Strain SAG 1380-2" /LENGTH=532 /DNA_ID=CAMNT_0027156163 /DNA_START=47 /DNA_END=1645 /DNA_ORIENTATION=-